MTPDQSKRIKAIEADTSLSDWEKRSKKNEILAEAPSTVVSKVKMPSARSDEEEEKSQLTG